LKQRDLRKLKTAEMKFIRCTAEYSLFHHRRNKAILDEFKVNPNQKEVSTVQMVKSYWQD
jgi:hypothetical protein